MNQDIDDNTSLKSGDWVIKKDTGGSYKIMETTTKDVFEFRPDGKNTNMRTGITFIGSRDELKKNYQKIVE